MPKRKIYNRQFRANSGKLVCMNAKATTGVGTPFDVSQYRHISVVIAGASSPSLTIKPQASFLDVDDPNLNFGAAQSVTNPWDYVGMYDLEDGSFIDGDTGIAFSGAADVRQFIINTDGIQTLNLNVTAISGGNVSVFIYGSDSQ